MSAEDKGFRWEIGLSVLVKVDLNGTHVGGGLLYGPADDSFGTQQRHMHNEALHYQDGPDTIVIRTASMVDEMKFCAYH